MTAATAAPLSAAAVRRRPGVLRLLLARRSSWLPLGLLVVVITASVAAPLIAPYGPNELDPLSVLKGPSGGHLLGTDELGRDLLSRTLFGGRLDLLIMALSTAVAMTIGVTWGSVAAVSRGLVDGLLMRLADGFMAMPFLVLALICVAGFGSSLASLILILGILFAPMTARIARTAVMSELALDYCTAARAYNTSLPRLVLADILPNILPILLTQAAVVASQAVLTAAALSFIGLGVQPPSASWGTLLREGYSNIFSSQLYVVWPGLAILAVVWCINALGDEIRAVLDPRLRRLVASEKVV
jgi:peptide/nickel transport system permease protein